MRSLLLFTFGALAATTAVTGWRAWNPDSEPPTPPTLREVERLAGQLAASESRRDKAERRAVILECWCALYRRRLAELGQPQSWGGPVVSSIYLRPEPADVAEPETIPPQNVPTREEK